MSETYQYAECKHCGKSVMESEIHSCRKMYLAEIADCHATMLRQGQKIVKLEEALKKIEDSDECDPEISISLLQLIAREALEDDHVRP